MAKITMEQAMEFASMGINREKIKIKRKLIHKEKTFDNRAAKKAIRFIKEGGVLC